MSNYLKISIDYGASLLHYCYMSKTATFTETTENLSMLQTILLDLVADMEDDGRGETDASNLVNQLRLALKGAK